MHNPESQQDKGDYIEATLMECLDCGARYPIVPYYKAAAPHGKDKSCRSTRWKRVKDDLNHVS